MMRTCIVAIIALGLTACASAPLPPPSAPTLAYVLPPVNPATYLLGDTTRIAIEAPGGRNLNTTIAVQAVADLGMHVDSAGMLASVRLRSVAGSFEAGGQISVRVDSSDTPTGSALLRMSAQGVDSMMHVPGMSNTLLRVVGGGSFFRHYFVRLPGREALPGTVWTDTLATVDDGAGVRSTIRTIVASSLQGDTVIGGQVLQVIESRLATTVDVQGVVEGMEVHQQLTGTGEATTLWDAARGLLIAREETGTANGTIDLPALGTGAIPVQARTHRVLTLQQ